MKKSYIFFSMLFIIMFLLSTSVPGHAQWWKRFRRKSVQNQNTATVQSISPNISSLETGKSVTVTVNGNNLQRITSVQVFKKSGRSVDRNNPVRTFGVTMMNPTQRCGLPQCRMMQLIAGKTEPGEYQVEFKSGSSIVKTMILNVTAPVVATQLPPKPAPMPRTGTQTMTQTSKKGSVAIDTVPLPEKPMERPQTGTAITKQEPRMTYDLSQQKKSPQQLSGTESLSQALRDDRYATSPEASKQNFGEKLGFCPTDGLHTVAEMSNCDCPFGYVKVPPKAIPLRKPGISEIQDMQRNRTTLTTTRKYIDRDSMNLYQQCIPTFPCPEGPFTTKENDDGKYCECPRGEIKTLYNYGSDYSECVSPDALYDMTIVLDKIRVFDDCDNVSSGDWKMIVRTQTNDAGATVTPQRVWWPNADTTKNVDGGKVYENPNRTITIRNIHANSNIDLRMTGVDCDDDMLFAITSWESLAMEFATSVIYDPFDNAPKFNCDGEEVYELSGQHDRLGVGHKTWVGDTNVVEYTRGFYIVGSRNNDCSDRSTYQAYFTASRTKASGEPTSGTSGGSGGSYGGGGGSSGNIRQHLK